MNHYDEAARLTRILAYAIEKLGGEMEVPHELMEGDSPRYVITLSDASFPSQMIKVRSIREELGEVLDVRLLEQAELVNENSFNKLWRASAHGQLVEAWVDKDGSSSVYVSPIHTMRTVGVALVDDQGFVVAYSVRDRTD